MSSKSSGFIQTEAGLIPCDWKVDRLENHLIIKGRIGWKGLAISEYTEKGPFIVGGLQIEKNGVIWGECSHLSEERYDESPEIMLLENDILMTKDGTIGKLAYIEKLPDKATVASHIHVIRKKTESIFPKFLFYFFKSPVFQSIIVSKTSGSVVPSLIQKDINSAFFPIPSLIEQKAISKILSELDAKIALDQQMNNNLEDIGKAVFRRWFIDFEFPNQDGKPYKSSGGEMVYSQELGKEIPSGWQLTALEKVAEFTRGFSYNGLEKSTIEGDLVFMTLNSIYEGGGFKREFAYLTSNRLKDRHLLNEGDLIIPNTEQTKTGTLLGFPALVEFPNNYGKRVGCFSHHLTKVTPFNEEMKHYLYYYLHFNQVNAIKYHTGSVIWGLDVKGFIENEMILIPNSEVLNAFSEFATQIFRKRLLNNKQSTTLSAMRDSLLPKLMSGKIRVPIEKQEA